MKMAPVAVAIVMPSFASQRKSTLNEMASRHYSNTTRVISTEDLITTRLESIEKVVLVAEENIINPIIDKEVYVFAYTLDDAFNALRSIVS